MPVVRRASGVKVTYPGGYTVVPAPSLSPRARVRSTKAMRDRLGADDKDAVAQERADLEEALRGQGLELIDHIELVSSPRATGKGYRAVDRAVEFAVDLQIDEAAVVLLEQDGMYTWQFPSDTRTRSSGRQRATRAASPAGPREVVFELQLFTSSPSLARAGTRGLVSQFVSGRVAALVLRFTSPVAVGKAIAFLERNVGEGLVAMEGPDPSQWRRLEGAGQLELAKGRSPRILLFVHGTFSSTVGSFGAQGSTPWGRTLLEAAAERYDVILGADHRTLSKDPLENAIDLLDRLRAATNGEAPVMDVIVHGRGGLVFRSLVEHLLPASAWRPRVERAVFVACPNGGTRLADPDNWKVLADLYTNLALGATRVMALLPGAQPVSAVVGGILRGVALLVKYMAVYAVSDSAVPGLEAMEPDGEFIRTINQAQRGQPEPGATYYFAITSAFEPTLSETEREPKELPARLLGLLVDGFADGLLEAPNDLFVDVPSMTAIDPGVGNFLKDVFDFGTNPNVYHTNYFTRPEVARAISDWLGLPSELGKAGGARLTTTPGMVVGPELPTAVVSDIVVIGSDRSGQELRMLLEEVRARYAVVRRPRGKGAGEYVYAFSREEAMDRLSFHDLREPLLVSLDLHEYDASETRGLTEARPARPQEYASSTGRRAVIFRASDPVGVWPETSLEGSSADLLRRAEQEIEKVAVAPAPSPGRARPRTVRKKRGAVAPRPTAATGARPADHRVPSRIAASRVFAQFHADMDQEMVVRTTTSVRITVAREDMRRPLGPTSAVGGAEVERGRKLTVQIIPRANVEVVGEDRVEIDVPEPRKPQLVIFDVKGTDPGEGEIWVVARQGQVPLITLELRPRIVKKLSRGAPGLAASDGSAAEAPAHETGVPELTIWETMRGTDTFYQFDLRAPAFKLFKRFQSPPITGNRQSYVQGLYDQIEKRWVSSGKDIEAFQAELRAFGGQLFDELFPDELQGILWKIRSKLEAAWIISTEPFIPWELVHLKATPRGPLPRETKFMAQLGVVRWLHGTYPPDRLQIRPGKARYAVPQYPVEELVLTEPEQERMFLERTFGATAVAPESNAVRKLLSKPGSFDLLHFAGHGAASSRNIEDAHILLEGRLDPEGYVEDAFRASTVQQFADLEGRDGSRPIVILNACQAGRLGYQLSSIGGFAQAFLSGGAGAFVSSLWAVGDEPARGFTEAFYSALLRPGTTVAQAVKEARENARKAGDATWLAYAVYAFPEATLAH